MPYKDREKHRQCYQNMINTRREKWFKENGPCKQCGSWDNLEVDHIDPTQKSFHINWARRLDVLEIELKKCQPLCHECHKLKSRSARGIPLYEGKVEGDFKHGTRYAYDSRHCRCQECKDAANAAARARKKAGKYSTKRHYVDRFANANQANNYNLGAEVAEKTWTYEHGRETAYRKHGCRCEACVQWYESNKKARQEAYAARRASE